MQFDRLKAWKGSAIEVATFREFDEMMRTKLQEDFERHAIDSTNSGGEPNNLIVQEVDPWNRLEISGPSGAI